MFYEVKEDDVHLIKASHCFLDPVALANAGLVKTDWERKQGWYFNSFELMDKSTSKYIPLKLF